MTAKEKFEARLNFLGLADEWSSIGRFGRVATIAPNKEIVLLVHENEKDKYTEIHYPSFDELRKNDKFVRRATDDFLSCYDETLVTCTDDEFQFRINLAAWLRGRAVACPLDPAGVYFAADGMETSYKDFSDDPVGIMDKTNNHNPALVAQINEKWEKFKDNFKPILCSLYQRDIDEITEKICMPEWEDWDEYKHGMNTGEWSRYNQKALAVMLSDWGEFVHFYLMCVADDQDLETIITFVRYDVCEGTGRDRILSGTGVTPVCLDGSSWTRCDSYEELEKYLGKDAMTEEDEKYRKWWLVGRFSDGNLWMNNQEGCCYLESNINTNLYYARFF